LDEELALALELLVAAVLIVGEPEAVKIPVVTAEGALVFVAFTDVAAVAFPVIFPTPDGPDAVKYKLTAVFPGNWSEMLVAAPVGATIGLA